MERYSAARLRKVRQRASSKPADAHRIHMCAGPKPAPRPILREIDEDVLRRSDIIAVDTRYGVFAEAALELTGYG